MRIKEPTEQPSGIAELSIETKGRNPDQIRSLHFFEDHIHVLPLKYMKDNERMEREEKKGKPSIRSVTKRI